MSDDGQKRPGWDARQRFFEVLMEKWSRLGLHASSGFLREWYVELHGIYTQCTPWMKESDRREVLDGRLGVHWGLWEIRKKLDAVGSSVLRDGPGRSFLERQQLEVERNLLLLQEKLAMATQHMMLPGGDDDGDSVDVESFLRESGS